MANLAIKGHTTRGEEVIEILEMLGGKNKVGLLAKNETLVYFIKNGVINNTCMNLQTLPFKTFTLEEFLEKYPYKVGYWVQVPEYKPLVYICKMRWNSIYNYMEYLVYRDDTPEWYTAKALLDYNESNNEETMKETNNAVEWGVELTAKDIEEITKADTNFCIRSVQYWSKK